MSYDDRFFSELEDGSRQSAEVVVPLVIDWVAPRTVIDVGCGLATWAAAFRARGVQVIGVDGDYVDRTRLEIPPEEYLARDLTQPLHLDRTFDLAVSLEVAEHLPPSSGAGFVSSLTRLAPVVLFSAAVPFQGGGSHLNEQWQHHWAEHFADDGFAAVDVLSPHLWREERVMFWYVQNMVLYVRRDHLAQHPRFAPYVVADARDLDRIHPRLWLAAMSHKDSGARTLPSAVRRALDRRILRGRLRR
jgi:SAM-dependent methyltransferase